MYADDSKILASINPADANSHDLQEDIEGMTKWCDKWSMRLNTSKCKVMHMGKDNPRLKYSIMDQDQRIPLETTRIEKDLGIMISEDGSYSAQVTRALSKANTILGRLLNTFKYFDSKIVKILYPIFVRPHIEFASTVWNDLKKEDIDRLEKFQRKVTRKATDIKHMTYDERLEILGLQKRVRSAKLES